AGQKQDQLKSECPRFQGNPGRACRGRAPPRLLVTRWAMLVGMAGDLWREQVAYYRQRAAEYDVTSYGDLPGAERRVAAVAGWLQPAGDVLEIACGTGMWTRHLLTCARSVTAIDAAPEMIAAARLRVPAGAVTFRVADVFGWIPPQRFDTVFFAFWLSHVPAAAFGRFWSVVRGALA